MVLPLDNSYLSRPKTAAHAKVLGLAQAREGSTKVNMRGRKQRRANRSLTVSGGANLPSDPRRASARTKSAEVIVTTNLPSLVPPMPGEIALWRAFLAEEIDAILGS